VIGLRMLAVRSSRNTSFRFEVSAETLAAVRSAIRLVAERSGQRLDDDAALLLLARAVLDTPDPSAGEADADTRAAGSARYQISIAECPRRKRGFMPAGADLREIDPASLAAARCDAQRIGAIHDDAPSASALAVAAHVGVATQRPRNAQSVPRGCDAMCSRATTTPVRSLDAAIHAASKSITSCRAPRAA
jgi:hypothetical protein